MGCSYWLHKLYFGISAAIFNWLVGPIILATAILIIGFSHISFHSDLGEFLLGMICLIMGIVGIPLYRDETSSTRLLFYYPHDPKTKIIFNKINGAMCMVIFWGGALYFFMEAFFHFPFPK